VNVIKKFEEFVESGVVRKHSANESRAEFLFCEAEKSLSFLLELLNKIPITDNNANNFVKHCYDILMELIRANMLLAGYHAHGFGAHEAEISYLRVLKFDENDIQFADQMRFFRNGMLYYGTKLDKEYAEKVFDFLQSIYTKLKKVESE